MVRHAVSTALRALVAALALAAPAAAHVPHDIARHVAVSPAFEQDHVLIGLFTLLDRQLIGRSDDGGRSWLLYGHALMSETAVRVVFSPDFARDATVFIVTLQRVWRSTDGGLHWVQAVAGPTGVVHDLAVSPLFASDGLLLAATSTGAWISIDGGETFASFGAGLVETSLQLARCAPPSTPGAPAVLYAGALVLHRSLDGGRHWQPLTPFGVPMASLALSPQFASDQSLLLSFGRYGGGVVASLDGGANFAPANTGLTDADVNDVAFAPDGELYCATEKAGAFRASGLGAPWTLIIDGFDVPSPQTANHNYALAISPAFETDARVWIAAYEGLYDSQDAGDHWIQDDVYGHLLNPRAAFSPGWPADRTLALGNFGDGELFGTAGAGHLAPVGGAAGASAAGAAAASGALAGTAGGTGLTPGQPAFPVWRASGTGIGILYTDTQALSPDFAHDDTLFTGGTGLWRSTDRGQSWHELQLPGFLANDFILSPAYATDRTLFLGSTSTGLFRSTDAGESWTLLQGGAPADFYTTRIAISPAYAQDRTVFFGSRDTGAWRTTDAGANVTQLPVLTESEARTVAVSPDFAQSRLLAVGFRDQGLWLSHDGGDNFARVSAGLPAAGLPDSGPLTVESLAFSPSFAQDGTAFLSTLEYGLFRSVDGGNSWTHLDGGLPLAATRAVEVSPAFAQDRTVLLTTWDWVWWSEDAGDTWTRLPALLRTDDAYDGVHVEGKWTQVKADGVFGTHWRKNLQPGGAMWFEFFGRRIAFDAVPQPSGCNALIELDGRQVATVPLAAPTPQPSQEVWSRTFPSAGWHVVRVVNGGGPNGALLASDGFETEF